MTHLRATRVATVLVLLLTCLAPFTARAQTQPPTQPPGTYQLGGVAQAHYQVSTSVPAAQAAFDRGLKYLYAFSEGEARLAFQKAENADPNLGIAYWGEALTDAFDINQAQSADGDKRGIAAMQKARAHRGFATPDERTLIDALGKRFSTVGSTADRAKAYATAMTAFVDAHPSDGLGLTLAAYAIWNSTADDFEFLQPGNTVDPLAVRIGEYLDRALAVEPDNLGAQHLRIHFEEMIKQSDRAIPNADYLAALQYELGMSHLPHMAGHIYSRVGNYAALVLSNQRAVANDAGYFRLGNTVGQQYVQLYEHHNLDFVAYGLTTQGRNAEANQLAAAHEMIALDVKTRLHENAAVLAATEHATETQGLALRAIAFAQSGKLEAARAALARATAAGGAKPNSTQRVWLAYAVGTVARAAGAYAEAATAYGRALKTAGDSLGDPKNYWSIPPGEAHATALLLAKNYPDAEAAFTKELERYPNDPRLLFGLAQAQHAQGEDDTEARAGVAREWKGAKPLTIGDLG